LQGTLTDIELGNNGAKMTISAWIRNLFNEERVFLKSAAAPPALPAFSMRRASSAVN